MMEDRLNRREAIRRGAILAAAATAGCVPGLRGGATSRRLRDYDIRDFGAVGNGSTSNTRSIQATIDAAAAAGGGNVVVPVGIFLSGAIFLRPGVNLRVDRNGVLKGSLDRADYPLVPTRWEGIERDWLAALVNADGLTGVSLTGEGTIDGQGVEWTAQTSRNRQRPQTETPPVPRSDPALGMQVSGGRPRLIAFQNCRDVRFEGFHILNHAAWGLHILYSENVVVDGLNIRAAHNIPSSDGIDVDSCRGVRIARVDIDVNDDCISIKSGKDADGRRVNRPCEDVIVENSIFRYGHGGVAMGSETTGGIRNVETRDCIMEADNWAPIRFKSQPSRGGVVENITYRDVELKDTRQAFEFNMEWRMVPPIAPPAEVLPVVRNVRIINVSGTTASVGLIHGLKDSPIQGVTFENCHVRAKRGLVVENVANLDLSGLDLQVEEGEAVIRRGA
jgi:polygalacturonase